VLALGLAGPAPALVSLGLRERVARAPVALADPPLLPLPKRKRGTSMVGTGMLTRSLPCLPMSSPCWTYCFRFCLMRPRTMARNRAWSCLIFSDMDPPAAPGHHSLASPRAKIDATKLSTSVEQISQ
jgi:hypothetical protein